MALLPILIELEGAPVLVAGGGKIALHKAQLFASLGADVLVVAQQVCSGIRELPVRIELRKVSEKDAEGSVLVADATGDPAAEEMLSAFCRKEHIPYICAGNGALCTAVLPAVYRKGKTVVAVSSQGASPAASARLRDMLSKHVPDNMDAILDRMSEIREISKKTFRSQQVRRSYLHACLDEMLNAGRPVDDSEELLIRQEISDKYREDVVL